MKPHKLNIKFRLSNKNQSSSYPLTAESRHLHLIVLGRSNEVYRIFFTNSKIFIFNGLKMNLFHLEMLLRSLILEHGLSHLPFIRELNADATPPVFTLMQTHTVTTRAAPQHTGRRKTSEFKDHHWTTFHLLASSFTTGRRCCPCCCTLLAAVSRTGH